jgi:cytochrome c biogenesis protein CcmG/thiol:disulfide interchange protein DsbE
MEENTIPQQEEHIEGDVQPTRSSRLGRIVVWAVVALIIVFLAAGLIQAFSTQPIEGPAPEFTLTTYDGSESYTLSELKGQVVVINFWASWCAPCAAEAPDLEQAWQDYQDDGVLFLGIAFVDSEAKATAYLERYGITYPNGPDLRSQISDQYRVEGVPETFIVDAEGEITFFAMRPISYAELVAEIEKAKNR